MLNYQTSAVRTGANSTQKPRVQAILQLQTLLLSIYLTAHLHT